MELAKVDCICGHAYGNHYRIGKDASACGYFLCACKSYKEKNLKTKEVYK